MNTWQALKKIVRDQFTRPAPWDGRHLLKDWFYVEHVAWPDDYNTGWVWECTCGTSNKHVIPPKWPRNESGAIQQYMDHAKLHENAKQSPWALEHNESVCSGGGPLRHECLAAGDPE